MLSILNRIILALMLLLVLLGIAIGIFTLLLPALIGQSFDLKAVSSMVHRPDLAISLPSHAVSPSDSPYEINVSIKAPSLAPSDQLRLQVFEDGRLVKEIDCLQDFGAYAEYSGTTDFFCTAELPYSYSRAQNYQIYAVLSQSGTEYEAGPSVIKADWSAYETHLYDLFWPIIIIIGLIYLLILLPVSLIMLRTASGMKHKGALPGEDSLWSLLNPFSIKGTLIQKVDSFITSPYFWVLEVCGILIILGYMVLSAQVWKSTTALIAFFISGLLAFIIPFLWCAALWYAEFRHREPLRILVTFFLWGMLAALMAIGINSLLGAFFSVVGLAFLSAFLFIPPVEEFYKGVGLCILSDRHDFCTVEDGLVFGFVIGMGFSFIEDWLYLQDNPFGSDFFAWLALFILRSIFFSANHGVYTAIIGAAIGYLKERGSSIPVLGLILALPLAAFLHSMHNTIEFLGTMFGSGGYLIYCCFFVPIFDYGAAILLALVFVWAIFRRKLNKTAPKKRKSI